MMNDERKFKEKFIVRLTISIFIVVILSYVLFILLVLGIIYFEEYKIDDTRAFFPPFFSLSTITLFCLVLGLFFSNFISRRFLKPISELQKGMNEVKNGNFNVNIENEYQDEAKYLIDNFNLMVEELKKSETLKSDFISNVSHEFKTPLASIQGYATLLQDDSLSKEDKEKYTKYIIDSSQKLNELVSNILKISKIDNQKIVIEPTIFSLDEQIRESILTFEKEWIKKDIELIIDLEELEIRTDKSLLSNVWNNLIGNAIKYSNENSKIEIKGYKLNNRIKIHIKDYGIGIKSEDLPYIFNKFYQVDSSRTSEGNGLGLALVKGILDLVDGTIEVNSVVNEGSEFIVTLKSNIK